MKKALASERHLGWYVLVGLAVFTLMTLILGLLADEVIKGEPLTGVDAQLSNWLYANRSPFLTKLFWGVTSLGSTLVASVIAIVVGLYLLSRRQPYWFATITLSIFGGMILNRLLKLAFQRARPEFDDPIISFAGYSFPSGHTMTATVVYGALAALLFIKASSRRARVLVVLGSSLIIALIGFSRIYLGAHYLSDVLGAIAEGLAWLSLCFTAIYSIWRRRSVPG